MYFEVKNIEVHYDRVMALRGVSIELEKGEIVTLIGANGAGKSTTLNTISGLIRAREGRIQFDGKAIVSDSHFPIAHIPVIRSNVGIINGRSGI